MPTHDDELKPLVLTDARVLIADLLVTGPVGSAPIKLAADAIAKATGLDRRTVSMNMRSMPDTGWFKLDWEDTDPYDFTCAVLRRRMFVNAAARDALVLCLKDFRAVRSSDRNAGLSIFQVQYAPPRLDHGVLVGKYVPVATWHFGGMTMSTERAALLIHCLEHPEAFYHPSEVCTALGVTQSAVRNMLARCEDAGLMVSKLLPPDGCRPARVFRLNTNGVAVARGLAERARGNVTS